MHTGKSSIHAAETVRPSRAEALRFWAKLGWISFGGPAGQIAVMQTELVDKRRWIEPERFLQALNFCMLLPGPEATQLAIYCGWRLHGRWGGLVAGILFVLPAALLLWALSWLYVTHGANADLAAVFRGLKAAVLAIVVAAVWRIGRRTLDAPWKWAVAAAAFAGIFLWAVPFPAVVVAAALVGAWRARAIATEPKAVNAASTTSWRQTLVTAAVGLTLWTAPILAAVLTTGRDGVLAQQGFFFSQAAMVTFGGAYAVLPYVGHAAVETYGWLTAPQMLDGLGLAETTPGPLIMVLQFVGFLGAWNHPGDLPPLVAATLGAAMTTWVTFVPCFLWIFLGAPHIERLGRNPRWNAALAGVTAAVVGVILNLAAWFGWHAVRPTTGGGAAVIGGTDWLAVAISVAAGVVLHRTSGSVTRVVLASGALGLLGARLGW